MMELIEKIIDLTTGKETTKPYSKEQIAEVEAEIAATQARLAAQDEANKARESVLAKLGLTAEEVSALLA